MTEREYKYHKLKKAIEEDPRTLDPKVEYELFKHVVDMFFDEGFEERFQRALEEAFNDTIKDKPTRL
jgi:hypothetical protein